MLFGFQSNFSITESLVNHIKEQNINELKETVSSIIITGGATNTKMFLDRL